ncbi:ATP-grasp domain-containing protein [Streptomyces fradiae]
MGVVHRPYGAAGLRDVYRAAQGLCRPVLIFRGPVAGTYPELVELARAMFPVHVLPDDDPVPAVAALRLRGLTTFHDDELDFTDHLLRALDLPGAPATGSPWDKLVQRRAFARAGLSTLPFASVDSAEEFRRALREVRLPAVLKPRRAVGGRGVTFLRDPDDVRRVLSLRTSWAGLLLEGLIPPSAHPSGVPWLADFVSVETVSTATRRTHCAVFDKAPVSIRDAAGPEGADLVRVTGDVVPSRLPAQTRDLVLKRTGEALDALGTRCRVTHTELRVTPDEIEVIEVNGRVGGHLTRLLRPLGGPDLVRSALTLALGETAGEELPEQPADLGRSGFMVGLFVPFPHEDGTVASRVSRADLRALPGVVGVDEVAEHGAARADTGFRAANVTLRFATAEELDAAVGPVARGIAGLFAADGLADDPWLRRLAPAREQGGTP